MGGRRSYSISSTVKNCRSHQCLRAACFMSVVASFIVCPDHCVVHSTCLFDKWWLPTHNFALNTMLSRSSGSMQNKISSPVHVVHMTKERGAPFGVVLFTETADTLFDIATLHRSCWHHLLLPSSRALSVFSFFCSPCLLASNMGYCKKKKA